MARAREYPQSREAERAVLGAMLLDREALHEGLERLAPDYFFEPAHRHIYVGLQELFQANVEADVVALAETLKRLGKLDETGGTAYLVTLVEDLTTVASFTHHLSLLEEKHLLRSLLDVSVDLADRASGERDDPHLLLDETEAKVFAIAERRLRQDFVPVGEVVGGVYDAIEARAKRKEHLSGLETGYLEVDDLTGGLQRQNLIIVAARPSVGKTALALNIAENLAVNKGIPVAIFSLEMSREALAQRLLCSVGRVDLSLVRSGRLSSMMWRPLTEAVNRLAEAPIYVDDSPALNILEIRAKARRIKARRDVQLIVVDYLQMVHGYGRYENRQTEIAAVSSFLKALAKELDVPVVACAQLSRAVERRVSGEPQLSDLRESGAIEQDADVVMFLHRPGSETDGEGSDQLYAETDVILAKQRHGPTGRVKLLFIRKYTRFENLTRREESLSPPASAAEEAF
ncbi:MAG: replicative DNA helicase [Candidatus Coatesbacteria bacterium]|nr:MAG: replicative DNA helicase [Candidatus Coatesbacteria bacterium]